MRFNKQKIIIFEGIDSSGKTTIAKALSQKIHIPYFRHDVDRGIYFQERIPNEMLFFAHDRLLQLFEKTGYSLICDRGFPSTFVYNQIFGDTKLNNDELNIIKDFDLRNKQLDTKIIVCFKDIKLENFNDEYVNFKKIKDIIEQYNIFLSWTKCNCLILDTTDENLKLQLKKVIKFIRS
jgi:thymidylate kinase